MTSSEVVLGRELSPGKLRGLQRITSDAGFFEVCALDHVTEFAELVDGGAATFDRVVQAKTDLVRAIADATSAVLVDAHYGAGYLAASGALPANVGLMVSMEDGDYSLTGSKSTQYRQGWNVQKAKAVGADAAKLLWWYRPDRDAELARSQRAVVANLVAECETAALPLVVEPIWYPLADEDPTDAAWRSARATGIVESAATAEDLGADFLKVEFPVALGSAADLIAEARATEVLQELDSRVQTPWVLLSAGVPYDVFARQVELSCRAGSSGYIAGRSLWRDAVSADDADRESTVAGVLQRLTELNAITRQYGRPYRPARDLDAVIRRHPEGWYRAE